MNDMVFRDIHVITSKKTYLIFQNFREYNTSPPVSVGSKNNMQPH
ncbi:unnamed protein product [Acanthoscelides obtectus]|uniref:Uncharacterized protein n=1 Tax=Acanthoscelides obtectus TaxID=200917 RepID=A0A9P0P8J8_ACAOB|nr:unnamed protein product [Acanthoscelides obtectus]CAK1639601.1 hypothetical protein AOBTE_LOCUS11267 [Acanthoscelides obtectus]